MICLLLLPGYNAAGGQAILSNGPHRLPCDDRVVVLVTDLAVHLQPRHAHSAKLLIPARSIAFETSDIAVDGNPGPRPSNRHSAADRHAIPTARGPAAEQPRRQRVV
jgi:hypothetical protein